jgi:hypothetical protein
MLVPNLLPKVVPHGSRLLPRFIVRNRGRVVASKPRPNLDAPPFWLSVRALSDTIYSD